MSRGSVFNSPLLLGFDQLERAIDRMSKQAGDGYPPYNVEQLDDSRIRITLALAGFAEDDLQIQVDNHQLMVSGKQQDDGERVYLHRGIAARQFQRNFMLADGVEVTSARLDKGLLHIDLELPLESTRTRSIKIERGSGAED